MENIKFNPEKFLIGLTVLLSITLLLDHWSENHASKPENAK